MLVAQAGASAVSISFCVAVAALVYAPRKGDTPNQPILIIVFDVIQSQVLHVSVP
jgi:hypothetical protein